ncbi:MAG: prephenate dehydrogenase/arogenate dehydrogenase family protein, partial [Phaeodactylibacter sp.]|nr:prephenate dehydrogenase/arogenate dehydrogenase family protein [Phaeodactylibacter sp.]
MTITIIGIGLIGGSLAITLKENGFARRIIGVDASRDNLDKAVRRRLIDEDMGLEEGVAAADVIVLATPADAMLELLPRILGQVNGKQTVIDVGSTKERLLEAVQRHPNRGRYVATHPMAGTEHSGPEAAIPNLFDQKCTVLVDVDDSDPDAVKLAERLYRSIPMRIVCLDRLSH